jgi:predicted ribosomally synthesized peptide with nif11-like leader
VNTLKGGENMSKENAIRFMMLRDKDDALKAGWSNIMGKYEGKNVSKDEWDKVLKEEVIPFAKEHGYDFSPEDLKELEKPAEGRLSDEELGRVAGGFGDWVIEGIRFYCDRVPDDQTFFKRVTGGSNNGCPDFIVKENRWNEPRDNSISCPNCGNLGRANK